MLFRSNYNGTPSHPVTVLAGIRARFPQSKVLYVQGTGLVAPDKSGDQAVEAARKKAGGLPMDEKVATDFALRSANLLAKLAITHNPVLDLSVAEQTLIASLGDKRVEIAKAAGDAAAMLDSKAAQGGLADRANDPNTPPDVRVSLYKSLATSAKFYGNRLGSEQISAIQQVVGGE